MDDHVERFNAAVTSGDFTEFVKTFAPDAVMTFKGPQIGTIGPIKGREAISAAYATQPPTDTMELTSVRGDEARVRWTHGGTGTMTLRRYNGLVTELTVVFD